jgi:hypothetical protein
MRDAAAAASPALRSFPMLRVAAAFNLGQRCSDKFTIHLRLLTSIAMRRKMASAARPVFRMWVGLPNGQSTATARRVPLLDVCAQKSKQTRNGLYPLMNFNPVRDAGHAT